MGFRGRQVVDITALINAEVSARRILRWQVFSDRYYFFDSNFSCSSVSVIQTVRADSCHELDDSTGLLATRMPASRYTLPGCDLIVPYSSWPSPPALCVTTVQTSRTSVLERNSGPVSYVSRQKFFSP